MIATDPIQWRAAPGSVLSSLTVLSSLSVLSSLTLLRSLTMLRALRPLLLAPCSPPTSLTALHSLATRRAEHPIKRRTEYRCMQVLGQFLNLSRLDSGTIKPFIFAWPCGNGALSFKSVVHFANTSTEAHQVHTGRSARRSKGRRRGVRRSEGRAESGPRREGGRA